MIIYATQQNNQYVGFGFTEDINIEISLYSNTDVSVVPLGETEDEIVARVIIDHLTHKNNGTPDIINIDETYTYTLTPAGVQLLA